MAWKVLITARGMTTAGERALARLREAGCDIVFSEKFGALKPGDLLSLLSGYDAVLASVDGYSREVLAAPALQRLKVIARWGVGYDSVDVAAATENGIAVTYTPGVLDDAVADYTFALLLSLARRVHEASAGMQRGEWETLWGDDVSGATLGIIGFGRIGKAVARRAAGFNMRILAHTSHPPSIAGVEFVTLDRLLAESDYVSLHAALTENTRGLIGEAELRRMKPTAYLINTGRGALVEEAALIRAVTERRIAGAALDVFAQEPLAADSPLRTTPRVLLSPHQSSSARGTGERVSLVAAQSIVDLMDGRQPPHLLNPEVMASPRFRARREGH